MASDHQSPRADDCTTTRSFQDHGIDDGVDLVSRTYARLATSEDGTVEFEPNESFYDRLESAFIWAYLGSVDESGVPPHVEAAIDDARATVPGTFVDRPNPDLRTEVVSEFYRVVAGYHCAYRGN